MLQNELETKITAGIKLNKIKKIGCVKLTLNALTEDRDREIDKG